MTLPLKASIFLPKKQSLPGFLNSHAAKSISSSKTLTPVASLSLSQSAGISETFFRSKKQGRVKMAEDMVKRVTGVNPVFPTMSDISSISMPFSSSPSDAAVPVHVDPNHFFQPTHDQRINTGVHDIAPAPVVEVIQNAGNKMARTVSIPRVASLEHPQKRIRGGANPSGPVQWEGGWDPENSHSMETPNKKNQV